LREMVSSALVGGRFRWRFLFLRVFRMKKFLMLAVVGGFAMAGAGYAEAADKPKPTRAELFAKLDKDSDGKLTLKEFTGKRDAAKAEKNVKRLDKNSDGALTLEECTAGGKKPKKQK